MNITHLIIEFVDLIKRNDIEIYNEAALQCELVIFLRKKYPDYKIQLERNISYFNLKKSDFEKKEIDITIFKDKNNIKEIFVIELKSIIDPKKARPATVFYWIKDLRFLEQLKHKGMKCYSIFFTNMNKYWLLGNPNVGPLLKDFRNKKMSGRYQKCQNLNKENKEISLENSYSINWEDIQNNLKYFIIEL